MWNHHHTHRARGHSLAKAPVDCRIRTLTELLQLFIRVQPAKGVARLKGRSEGEGRGGKGRGGEGRGKEGRGEEKRGERGEGNQNVCAQGTGDCGIFATGKA